MPVPPQGAAPGGGGGGGGGVGGAGGLAAQCDPAIRVLQLRHGSLPANRPWYSAHHVAGWQRWPCAAFERKRHGERHTEEFGSE